MARWVCAAVALVVTLPLGDCQLDSATITFVPPNVLHVVTLSNCGNLQCWDKWVDIEGKKIRSTRACSATMGSGDVFSTAPSATTLVP